LKPKIYGRRFSLKILKSRHHSWIGRIIRHNEFVVNIFEGPLSGKRAVGRPRLQYLKQVARHTGAELYSNEKWGLQQFQMESCQPIKRLEVRRRRRIRTRRILIMIGTSFFENSGVTQEEDSCHRRIGLKFKEETVKPLCLEHSFVWCWNVYTGK
jgi:hypothetical protein